MLINTHVIWKKERRRLVNKFKIENIVWLHQIKVSKLNMIEYYEQISRQYYRVVNAWGLFNIFRILARMNVLIHCHDITNFPHVFSLCLLFMNMSSWRCWMLTGYEISILTGSTTSGYSPAIVELVTIAPPDLKEKSGVNWCKQWPHFERKNK